MQDIPGSSPDWRAANMKTKGRAMPSHVPPSHLGGSATGLASWANGTPAAGLTAQIRRHFHSSQLAQTTAWDCLPCVDTADKQPGCNSTCTAGSSGNSGAAATHNSSSNTAGGSRSATQLPLQPSQSLQLANKQWRRHRREVPAPPGLDRPQGKRMLPNTAPPSTCKELLQDPQLPLHASTARAARPAAAAPAPAAAAAGVCAHAAAHPAAALLAAAGSVQAGAQQPAQVAQRIQNRCSPADCAAVSPPQHATISCSSSQDNTAAHTTSSLPAPGSLSHASRSSSSSKSNAVIAAAATTAAAATAAAAASTRARSKKGPRVEDNPDFFRTPKDPPTLQRFAAALSQMSLSAAGASSVVQRHEAGIRSRQQAQVAAAAREVAALDAGAPSAD